MVLEKQIENTKHRKSTLKSELHEIQYKMTHYLTDPEAADKLKMQHAYLDSMIKGEYIQIKSLNDKIEKFVRFDYV